MKKLMFLATFALAGAVLAQAPRENGPRPPMTGGAHMAVDPIVRMVSHPKAAEALGITAEQREKLDACLMGGREQAAETQKKLRGAMDRQMKLLDADKVDEAAVMAAIDEVFDLRKEMAKAQTKRVIAVKSILTPEQIAKGREQLKQMRGRRGGRPEGGPRPHGGDRPGRRQGPRDGAAKPASAEK